LYSAVPLFQRANGVFTIDHWQLSGLLFDCYWIVGAIAGALFTLALEPWRRDHHLLKNDIFECGKLPASLSLLTGVSINLVVASPGGHFGMAVLVAAIVIGGGILWILRRPASKVHAWIEFSPFVLGLALITPMWIAPSLLSDYPRTVRMVGASLSIVVLLCGNRMLHRVRSWPAQLHFVSGMAVLAILVVWCGFVSGEHKLPPRVNLTGLPNPGTAPIVLVSLDTTRADHTSLAGYSRNTTPHLAEFAAGATVFPNALAAYDMTLGSHASMFTGMYPSWHGARMVYDGPKPLDDRLPTMAGILSGKGYFSAAIVANTAYLMPKWGLIRGFDYYDCQASVRLVTGEWPFQFRQGMRLLLDRFTDTTGFFVWFRRGQEVNDAVVRTLTHPDVNGRSFFLFVNYMDAHTPYVPPAPYDRQFSGAEPHVTYPEYEAVLQHRARFTERDYARLAADYDGGVAYEDFSFGQLIQWLKSRGIYDNAMIIVTGDHGEALGEHGNLGHGLSVHGYELNVPLLIKYPHQTAGAVVRAPASHVDLLPTVMDTLGYEIPGGLQGRSLRRPEDLAGRPVIGESDRARALLIDGMKLIVHADGKRELYDVVHDPAESRDLYAAGSKRVTPLEAAFKQWAQRIPNHRISGTPDAEEIRRLKSLGYLQ
jgi:arylsulfatase A-like enzyme